MTDEAITDAASDLGSTRRVLVSAALATACTVMWIAAGGDYLAVGLNRLGLPTGPFRMLASPTDAVWLASLVAGPIGVILAVVLTFRHSHSTVVRTGMTVLALSSLVATSVGPTISTRTRFELMRPDLDRAASLPLVTSNPFPDYYEKLPPGLAYLSVRGLVSTNGDGQLFVPQWAGIPDDAGGFIYSPQGSPEGMDMWGMGCKDPVRLDGDWWACGMAEVD